MYVFNRITVNPQLPKRINRLDEISNNLWWSWNTDFLELFKQIDKNLWYEVGRNPVKFLKLVSQERLEELAEDADFLKKYDKSVSDFDNYMHSTNTWYDNKYPNTRDKNLIAYFSAEYGLDEIIPIYSGGLGILSGDHLKSASDLGIPLVGVGLLYKNGYFDQKINEYGIQKSDYQNLDITNLPITPVHNEKGEDLLVSVKFYGEEVFVKVWQINVGRVKLYLMDSDIPKNRKEYRETTLKLYGGDKETRIRQEIILGIGGARLLSKLNLKPTIYHMNEGHSSFLTLELMRKTMEDRQVSFNIARDIVSAKTVFTTHTPVPAGNDIFDIQLIDKYFGEFWGKLGIPRDRFLRLGMKCREGLEPGFNMGILALKISGKKNGVSKLHCEVSKELFGEIWSNIATKEAPITYVTNGIHTCSWLAPNIKRLYNKYLVPYWQDNIQLESTWKNIKSIPDEELWEAHNERKVKLMELVKQNEISRLKNTGISYETLKEIVSNFNPDALTIGFARRFATYKRANLIFKNIERITEICNDKDKPVQFVFAGKAHPADKEGQDLIKYIHEISMVPQFKGKIFILENYNIEMARYLVSGVDVWLNNPRRPMEASGTSGQKASINGVVNFSILDGWWAEGYNGKNGWAIGSNKEYSSYEEQDIADSNSIYDILENEIIPAYYNRDDKGLPREWIRYMKSSIESNAGRFSTARMLVDYMEKLYMPLYDLSTKYFSNLDTISDFNQWKRDLKLNWNDIEITQFDNVNNKKLDAGNTIEVNCQVKLPNISVESIEVEAYFGKIMDNGTLDEVKIIPMKLIKSDENEKRYTYKAKIELTTGGEYGYTFRVVPKHYMLLDQQNLNLVKWITK